VSFVAGGPSATTSSIVTSSPTVTADGTSTTTLTVTVEDALGHAVAGTAVTLSGSGSANSFGAISGTTNANGVFTTTLASTLAQNETITATEGSTQEHTSVSFVAGPPSATTSSIVGSSPTVTADGTSTTTLTVTVEDTHGNAVANTAVTLSGSGSANSFGAISGTTNANGVFTTTLASTLVQNETITATEGSVQEHTAVSFVPAAVVIQTNGSTSLTEIANTYSLYAGGSGHSLKYGGAAVTAGEFDTWTPIGAIQVSGGYDVAWKDASSGQYTVWSTDSSGNYLSNIIGVVGGGSLALETLETTFHQDLNGDGTIGQPMIVIQTDGTTALTQIGNTYNLYTGGSGPSLKYGGAAVTAGEFGIWTPVGAIQVSGGYDVAWKDASSGQYTVWSTDSSGNYLSNIIGVVSGSSLALETLETTFHQDLNGDGTIGPTTVVIQTDGTTALTEIANTYSLYTSGAGPSLKYGGAAVTAGEFGTWTPIGAIQVSGGYDVAWKDASSGQYTVWSTDSSGNYLSNIIGVVGGGSLALETLETTFHQDLNGDGTIGQPMIVIQTDGTTALTQIGNTYNLYTGGAGPSLKYGGAAVTAGEFGIWTPVGAVQVSGGYDVAWKDASSGQYTVWGTDSSGNYLSNIIGVVSGSSLALKTMETTFHQDLNGDGVIGLPAATSQVATNIAVSNLADSGSINAAAAFSHDSFVFAPNFGHVTIANDAPLTGIDFSHAVFANINSLLAGAHDDGHGNVIITDAAHDTLTIQNMTSQQLHSHQSDFHII
jgi:20S proteasome alpha/beta subunit